MAPSMNGSLREFLNPEVSRSGFDRCLRRHGVGNLRDLQAKSPRPKHKAFKAYEPGYPLPGRALRSNGPRGCTWASSIYLKWLTNLQVSTCSWPSIRCPAAVCLQTARGGATRWVFIRIYSSKTAANARRFLRDLERACPMQIRTIFTDNGKEFTDRLFGLRKRAATGKHEFDLLCSDLGIDHRLVPPQHTQTNGMVERFTFRDVTPIQLKPFFTLIMPRRVTHCRACAGVCAIRSRATAGCGAVVPAGGNNAGPPRTPPR